jgi:hypothetical protein
MLRSGTSCTLAPDGPTLAPDEVSIGVPLERGSESTLPGAELPLGVGADAAASVDCPERCVPVLFTATGRPDFPETAAESIT